MIAFDKDKRADINGEPLHGRVFFFQKDTEQLDTIYIYDENDELVECSNPVYTDLNGFLEYDVILDNRIYSIHQERYNGDYDDPKKDERTERWIEDRDYYAGMIFDKGKQDSIVYGYAGIADTDTNLGSITVVGYHNEFDCEARTYVWDETSNDAIDYGQVFGSNLTSNGRWLLINTLPYIPSEYYGVYEGHLENLNALFGAKLSYGTNQRIISPKTIKMKRGNYAIGANYTTTRTLLLEDNVDFGANHQITCKDIQFVGNHAEKPIANFKFTGNDVEIDSYIFYDLYKMLTCGAKTIHIYDKTSTQTNTKTEDKTCSNVVFIGHGYLEFTGNKELVYDNCRFIGEKFIQTDYHTSFKNMELTDIPFDGGISSDAATCSLDLQNFRDADIFVGLATKEFDYQTINLQGREVATSSTDIYTLFYGENITFQNGKFGKIALTKKTYFENCEIDDIMLHENVTAVFRNCQIKKFICKNGCANIHPYFYDSTIEDFQWDSTQKGILQAYNTRFHCPIGDRIEQALYGDISNPYNGDVYLYDSIIESCIVVRGELKLYRCYVEGDIWTQDYLYNNIYIIRSDMRDSTINGRHLLQHYVAERTGVRSTCSWIGNTFNYQNDIPIYPESWSDRGLGEGVFDISRCTKLYLDPLPSVHQWKYKANRGPKAIPDYPTGCWAPALATNTNIRVFGAIPAMMPGHSISACDGTTRHYTDEEKCRFRSENMTCDLNVTSLGIEYIMPTNKVEQQTTSESWVLIPRKTTKYWENTASGYLRQSFDLSATSEKFTWTEKAMINTYPTVSQYYTDIPVS